MPAGLDRGVAGPGLQLLAEDLDLDEVTIHPPRLGACPEIGLANEAGDEHRGGVAGQPMLMSCGTPFGRAESPRWPPRPMSARPKKMAYDLEEPMRVLAAWAFFGGVFAVQNP